MNPFWFNSILRIHPLLSYQPWSVSTEVSLGPLGKFKSVSTKEFIRENQHTYGITSYWIAKINIEDFPHVYGKLLWARLRHENSSSYSAYNPEMCVFCNFYVHQATKITITSSSFLIAPSTLSALTIKDVSSIIHRRIFGASWPVTILKIPCQRTN